MEKQLKVFQNEEFRELGIVEIEGKGRPRYMWVTEQYDA